MAVLFKSQLSQNYLASFMCIAHSSAYVISRNTHNNDNSNCDENDHNRIRVDKYNVI